jgi:hypothetical protein
MLIQRIYQADPLVCPHCGGRMKIIGFIEARQGEVIRKILQHCGLWNPPTRAPPRAPPAPRRSRPVQPQRGLRMYHLEEIDPDFLEHLHREAQAEQLGLPWDA